MTLKPSSYHSSIIFLHKAGGMRRSDVDKDHNKGTKHLRVMCSKSNVQLGLSGRTRRYRQANRVQSKF